jgi:hypothetical protein
MARMDASGPHSEVHAVPLVQLKKHNRYDYSPLPERPDFSWPNGKRLAVCINNDIEVFSFLRALRRALAHIMQSRDQIWITTPRSVAAHFERVVPPPSQ